MKSRVVWGVFFCWLIVLSCRKEGSAGSSEGKIVLTDSYGRRVEIVKKQQLRVVSLAPSLTEILFLLDEGKTLVGRSDYCDYPEEAKRIERVGSIQQPSMEKIVSLNPDLLLASDHFTKDHVELLERLGIPVYLGMQGKEFHIIYKIVKDMGALLDLPEKAEEVNRKMKEEIDFIRQKTQRLTQRPRVYYVISFGEGGDFSAGKDTYIAYLIRLAGGINIADDSVGWKYSIESIYRNDPDIILCSKYADMKRRLEENPLYRPLRAVGEGKVYEVDNNEIDRFSPRNVKGVRTLTEIFHPGLLMEEESFPETKQSAVIQE